MIKETFEKKIYRIITANKQITCKKIAKKLKCSETDIRKGINILRKEYIPVIANNKGYYISFNDEDIEKQIRSLQCRINAMNQAKSGLEHLLRSLRKIRESALK